MSDLDGLPATVRDWIAGDRFLRRVRSDFADRDAIRRGELGPELECTCNLCWAENFAAVHALRAVAAPGMTEREIDGAVWRYMRGPKGRGREGSDERGSDEDLRDLR